jgi:hypothetical protein
LGRVFQCKWSTNSYTRKCNFLLCTASAYCKELSNPSPTVSGVTGGSFTASPSGLSINATSGAIDLSLSTAGTYTVTYTTPNCSTTSTQTVTIYDSPTADAGSDISVCEGQSASLGASGGNSYVWSPTTGLSNPNIANPTVTPTSTTTYTVTVTDGNNCTDSDDIIVTFVNDNTAGTASSTPTLCINTALTNITHTTTGATGIGSATGLPNGVSASWSSNTITLSGTPTESGTFSYTVPLTGGCGTVSATGTITVNPDNTVGTASSSPTLCINTALTDITHATTGATGIGSASGLPSGVTASWASDVITITGTPTASGTFNYTIPLSGGCGSVDATGTIIVTPDNTAGSASSSPTLCVNFPLTNITHTTTGATGIGTATGLPSGVTASWSSNTITISGTPTASGTFSYTIPLSGGCGTVNATGTITVTENNTSGTIAGDESGCSGFDPATITSSSTPTGGTGSVTYLWEYSTSSSSGPWTTIAPPPGNTVSIPEEVIMTNTDGGFEYDGQSSTHTTADNMRLGNRSGSGYGDTWGGMRFTTVPIPQGATINSAILSVYTYINTGYSTNPTQVKLKIYAEAVDNSTTFSDADNNIRNRSATSAQVDWDISSWVNGINTSVDFSSVIQEIVNRPGWSTNNAINILIKDDGSTTGAHLNIYQKILSSATPKLNVTYSTGGPHSSTYDPSTITQTTWYRRGAYTCSPSSVVYTAAIEKTVLPDNTAGTASSSPTLCINTALTDITHATTGATGIGSASGLPSVLLPVGQVM